MSHITLPSITDWQWLKNIFDQKLFLKWECYKYMTVLKKTKCIAI